MNDIKEVAESVYLIDDYLYSIPRCGCVYLLIEEKKALIDTGPATSINAVLDGIKKVGVKPEDVDYIVATHIHLDHAGGAGLLLKSMPKAQVLVHPRGAKHLIDPTRLVNSALEVWGEEGIKREGEVVPIESERVVAVQENDTIRLSERQVLEIIETPGHAPHEICITESRNNGVFVGDALGIYIPEGEILLPLHPPPNFDLELALNTIERIAKLNASILYFPHFGVTRKVKETLQLARQKLEDLDKMLVKVIKEAGYESAAEQMISWARAELEPVRKTSLQLYEYEAENYIPLCATGHIKYYQEKLAK